MPRDATAPCFVQVSTLNRSNLARDTLCQSGCCFYAVLSKKMNHIQIGKSSDTRFVAFGDDSQYKDILVFAYVIIARTRLRRVTRDFQKIKEKFKFPENTPIHCRTLFSGQQRAKANLSHLSRNDIQSLIHHAITLINLYDVFLRYAYARTANLKDSYGKKTTIELQNVSDGTPDVHPFTLDPKGIIGLLAQGCFASAPDGSQGPVASDCEIFASKDSTKIKFLGPNNQRADSLIQGFSDIGAPEGRAFHIAPNICRNEFSPLFELADIAAYLCSHALHGEEAEPFFCGARSRVKHWAHSEFMNPSF